MTETKAPPLTFTIRGHLVSLKNSRTVIKNSRTGQLFPAKNAKILQFEEDFLLQCPKYSEPHFAGDVMVIVHAFYPSRRQDLDCALVYDLLAKAEIIKNDRQVKAKQELWCLDRKNPRVIVTVWQPGVPLAFWKLAG